MFEIVCLYVCIIFCGVYIVYYKCEQIINTTTKLESNSLALKRKVVEMPAAPSCHPSQLTLYCCNDVFRRIVITVFVHLKNSFKLKTSLYTWDRI